ncbi:hypothetical protein HYDPIDRAFT_105278 [Hydnomerulius pinastri MD-312]|nr:hypothetical protein HYDPIDRAFT_105278 [Hydnomerulius pinastri MD-312]
MPPKRKAPEDVGTATDPSPPKRVTRRTSSRTLAAQQDTQVPDATSKKSPGKRANGQTGPSSPENLADHPSQTSVSTRRRKSTSESPAKKSDSSSSPHKQPTTTRSLARKGSSKENAPEPSSEPDELNISPPKLPMPPSTPGPRPVSRMVMECVEITTPKSIIGLVRPQSAFGASPAGNVAAAMRAKGAPFLKPPATPSRQARAEPASPPATSKILSFPSTPSRKRPPVTPHASPSRLQHAFPEIHATPGRGPARPPSPRKARDQVAPQPSINLPNALPTHLAPCLRLQKRAILGALQSHSIALDEGDDDEQLSTNAMAHAQIQDLLSGTVNRGEGNSCLLLGPRGSGKTSLVERAIKALPEKPIILRLSGYAQHNDRLALREIARQLSQQTGRAFLADAEGDAEKPEEEPNPFLDPGPSVSVSLPPPSHLPALIAVLPTLSRPTVVILDAFDLFAQHARQSLLYCLLDTVQSCRVGRGNNGLAVIGITTRIDTINLLEKRVKSRFSGRMLRTAPPSDLQRWISLSKETLCTPIDGPEEWEPLWQLAVDKFLGDRKVTETMRDTFALTRDVRMLKQILTSIVADLRPASPFPTLSHITSAVTAQRVRQRFPNLHTLSYPSICLLIATMHAHTAGHDVITFEMLYDAFREQFRASSAAPIQIEGGSIGMARCTREVLMSAFEQLQAARMFVGVAALSTSVAPEFVRYRCLVEREDVRQAVNMMGQTNLRKWLHKAS